MGTPVDTQTEQVTNTKHFNELQIEEYRTLRAELDDIVKALRQIELYTVGAISAVYAWLATHNDVLEPGSLPWYLPVAIAFFGGLRNRALVQQMKRIDHYLQVELEPSVRVEGRSPLRWYSLLRNNFPKGFIWYDSLFWGTILVMTWTVPALARHFLHGLASCL